MKTININTKYGEGFQIQESFKALRTNLQFSGSDVKTFAVTSSLPNEGKSFISVELAISLAEFGKKVLLLDCDLRKSVLVSKYVNYTGINGLSQYLSGQASIEDVTYATQINGLCVIFSGPFPPNPVELLGGQTFKSLIEKSRELFDYIIIDTPPLGQVIDSAVVASICDGAILVIAENQINYRLAQNVKNQLEKSNCRILGAILNMTGDSRGKHYGRHYGKYYNKFYGKYYSNYYNYGGGEYTYGYGYGAYNSHVQEPKSDEVALKDTAKDKANAEKTEEVKEAGSKKKKK